MTNEVNTDPLEPLRKQWEREKSPRLSLQLAEEYGRRNDYLSAITVLRTGLTSHPRHVASRVLLARHLVELEQWPEARETLEKVASEDPTHLIANKLLVRTHLATGDLAEARNRLDLYTLLNESDPEIEEMESAFTALAAGEPVDGQGGALARPGEVAAPTADAAAVPAEPVEPVADDAELPAAAGDEVPLPAARLSEELGHDAEAPAAVVDDTPAAVAPRTRGGGVPGLETIERPPAATADEPFGDLFGPAPRQRAAEGAAAGDIFDLARRLAAPVPPPAVAPPREAELASIPAAAPPPEAAPVSLPDAAPAPEAEPTAESEAAAAAEPPAATVSLGRLYLRQGHAGEAERTFLAVLAADPDDAAARAGLAAARGAGEWALTALDLVPRESLTASPDERKRAVLTGYLERLRSGTNG